MSLYTFAAANLTTSADGKRRPAVNPGQIVRTLALLALVLSAATLAKQHMRAGEGAPQPTIFTATR